MALDSILTYQQKMNNSSIDSQSFKLNDPEQRRQVFQAIFDPDSYDFTPNTYSNRFKADMDEVYKTVASIYASRQGEGGLDMEARMQTDIAIACLLGKDIKDVNQNHNAYIRMLTGKDMDDKGFWEAFSDSWSTQDKSKELSDMMNRFDSSEDDEEKEQLVRDMQKLEADIALMGDYTPGRNGISSLLIESAPVLNQSVRTAMYSIGTGLALAALVAAAAPTGGSSLALAGGLLSTSGAFSAGAAAGTAIDAITNVYAQERGSLSWQLYNTLDANGQRMDDELRKNVADVGGIIITAIEYFTPEPSFLKLFGKTGLNNVARGAVVDWMKEVGYRTFSESSEEFLQGGVSYVATEIGKFLSDKYGNTAFGSKDWTTIATEAVQESVNSFTEAVGPSLVASVFGATAQSVTNRTQNKTYRDLAKKTSISTGVTTDEAYQATSRQMTTENSRIVLAKDLQFMRGKPQEVAPNNTNGQYQTITVVKDAETGKLKGATEQDENLMKFLYNKGARSFVVEVQTGTETVFTTDELMQDLANFNAVYDEYESTSETHAITTSSKRAIFRTYQDLDNFLRTRSTDINFSHADYRTGTEAVTSFSYLDENGIEQIVSISVDSEVVDQVLGPQTSYVETFSEPVDTDIQNETVEDTQTDESINGSDIPTQEEIEIQAQEDSAFLGLVDEQIGNAIAQQTKIKNLGSSRRKIASATASMLGIIERATGVSRIDMLSDRLKFVVDTSENASTGYTTTEEGSDGNPVYVVAINRKTKASTMIHELSHVLRLSMTDEQLRNFNRAYFGSDAGAWSEDIIENADGTFSLGGQTFDSRNAAENLARSNEERFVEDFQTYMRTNSAPSAAVESFFQKLRSILMTALQTYREILSPEVRDAFNELFSDAPIGINTVNRRLGEMRLFELSPEIQRMRENYRRLNTTTIVTGDTFLSAHGKGYIIPSSSLMERFANGNPQEKEAAAHEIAIRNAIKTIPHDELASMARLDSWDKVVERIPLLQNENTDNALIQAYQRAYSYLWAPVLQKGV